VKATISNLLRQTREGRDTTVRREAILALGYEKGPAVLPALAGLLDDPSPEIQHAAVIALGKRGDPAAVRHLAKPKILRSPSTDVRWAAVTAIGQLGDASAVDLLVSAAGDDEWVVRDQAVSELKRILGGLASRHERRAVRIFMKLLDLENREIADTAVDGLVSMGRRSVNPLLRALWTSSPGWRASAAKALGRIGEPGAVPHLVRLLSDPDARVRRAAVEALSRADGAGALEAVLSALEDNVPSVQGQAQKALVDFGPAAVEPILHSLRHVRSKSVSRAMLLVLGDIGDPRSLPELVRPLRSTYFLVRAAAIHAVVRFGADAVPALAQLLPFNRSDIGSFLAEARRSKDALSRIRAIRVLAALEDHRAVATLKTVAENGDPETAAEAEAALFRIGTAAWGRCAALVCIREIGHGSSLPLAFRSLEDPSANVRLEAIRALGRIPGPGRAERLVRIARTEADPYLRAEALAVLRQAGLQKGLSTAALACLADADWNVRAQAAGLLGNLRDRRTVALLVRSLGDDHWSVQEGAENALQNFGSEIVPALLRALRDRSAAIRFRAARLAGELAGRNALPALRKAAQRKGEKSDVARTVREAIDKIEEKHSNP
jgi:HEAT repeat protein